MGRFLSGFLAASVLWGGLLFAARQGAVDLFGSEDGGTEVVSLDAADAGTTETRERRRRPRRRRGRVRAGSARGAAPTGTVTEGDDLGEDGPRELDVGSAGGEAQLSPAEVSAAMDAGFGSIRRCLVLAAGEDPVTGRLVFGLRIGPDGKVLAVNLTGPAAVATGEAGRCLRTAAKRIRFPAFDGPPMTARYPITLE